MRESTNVSLKKADFGLKYPVFHCSVNNVLRSCYDENMELSLPLLEGLQNQENSILFKFIWISSCGSLSILSCGLPLMIHRVLPPHVGTVDLAKGAFITNHNNL